jgi:sugar phosphate isomerase/epimerase
LETAGVTRIGTWLRPMHDEMTYLEYFRVVSRRLRELATIVGDHGMRFGLEYVGTPSLRIGQRFQFVHTMAETKELIAEAGRPNLGFVLDSWHWWTAGETKADILTLKNEDVVSADLNDAPAGLELIEQQDNTRELPVATGVIPAKDFLQALVEIGYDGPVRPEPFNKKLNGMDDEPASETAATAMKKAFALVA